MSELFPLKRQDLNCSQICSRTLQYLLIKPVEVKQIICNDAFLRSLPLDLRVFVAVCQTACQPAGKKDLLAEKDTGDGAHMKDLVWVSASIFFFKHAGGIYFVLVLLEHPTASFVCFLCLDRW